MAGRFTPRGLVSLALLAGAGCGAKTGLRVPDVPEFTDAVRDVPDDAPRRDLCVNVTPDAGVISVDLLTRPKLSIADVFFVVDRTGSMEEEIDSIKLNLQRTIVPGIAAAIGDVQFGVATYADFPFEPYGDPGDVPFTLVSPIDRSLANVQGAVNSIRVGGGGDNAEALVETLFQVPSGEGYSPWIPPASPCGSPGRVGYGCLRPNAQTIFIVIADAPMHNGPDGRAPYTTAAFTRPARCPTYLPSCAAARGPHSYDEAVAALRNVRARVIGIDSGRAPFSGQADLQRLARDTDTITAAGAPLVFSIGSDGRELDQRVVNAVQTFTQQVRFNASARVLDLDPTRPATSLVRAIRPASALPADAITRIDGSTFYGVVPGTQLTFTIELVANIPRMSEPQRFPARVQFLADGRPNLGFQDIEVVIPALDGSGCDGTDAGAVGLPDASLDVP
ncbi:MAG: hypothetical protein R3A48_21645 [Polyangiales bacterium]